MSVKPDFIEKRQKLWDELMEEHNKFLAEQEKKSIKVTLKDDNVIDAISWESTPYNLIRSINQSLADNSVIAKVNNELWDLDRPLECDCTLEVLDFENKEGEQVFWHSSAHILGEALELQYESHLCYGPPIETGFYYDMYSPEKQVKPEEFKSIDDKCKKIVKQKQKFERLEVSVDKLLEMFQYNEFKCRILKEKVKTPRTTIYRCGDLIDLCRGPHVRNTGKIKAMCVTKNSASYWEGDANKESLQRVYGISFPNPKQLDEWKKFQEEAAKRDHRVLGIRQKLFFFHEYSPGSVALKPKGAVVKENLIKFIKDNYFERDFQIVDTPVLYNRKLWETSGHWQHYAENMFNLEVDKCNFALKPMNCPMHCLMFKDELRSYKSLPVRFADFGVLHRNEASGALSGLTRVRKFQQDDAHIFCTEDQITQEIESCLKFMKDVYDIFGFEFKLKLSTRPDDYLGDINVWNKAEKQLENALNNFGKPWELNEKDGAFYGPKIDITLFDALKRQHQCATIQLDFQLPERFELTYMQDPNKVVDGDTSDNDNKSLARPVIIHRAILGSLERFMAILIESFGGRWPFWISPFQVIVLPFNHECDDYALELKIKLRKSRFECDIDLDHSRTIQKKVKFAQDSQYNFMLVVGKKELANGTVNVRTRDEKVHGEHSVEHVIERFVQLRESKTRQAEQEF